MIHPIKPRIPAYLFPLLNRFPDVYLVGGAPRDLLLERTPADWDLAVPLTFDELDQHLADLPQAPYGRQHGTITVLIDHQPVEITVFRGATIQEDLLHRDLTINAIALHWPSGRIIDPWNGAKDLQQKLLRCPEDPASRLREDPLRAFRIPRFAAQLNFRVDQKTQEAIGEILPLLPQAAVERISKEIQKLLLAPYPNEGLKILQTSGLLDWLLPGSIPWAISTEPNTPWSSLRKAMAPRLAALFLLAYSPAQSLKAGQAFFQHFPVAGKLRGETLFLLEHLVSQELLTAGEEAHWEWALQVRQKGRRDLLALSPLADPGLPDLKDLLPCPPLDHIDQLAVNGRDLILHLNRPPGPWIGDILNHLLAHGARHPEDNQKERLLTIAKEINK